MTKPGSVLEFFTAIKCMCEAFWAFITQIKMTDFPTPSVTSASEIPTPSYT